MLPFKELDVQISAGCSVKIAQGQSYRVLEVVSKGSGNKETKLNREKDKRKAKQVFRSVNKGVMHINLIVLVLSFLQPEKNEQR